MVDYDKIVAVIIAIAAIHLGAMALGLDVIDMALSSIPILVQAIYVIVGLAGVYSLVKLFK